MANTIPANHLKPDVLKQVFIHNLNRLYFGKSYLYSTLKDLISLASFNALKLGLQEVGDDAKTQIDRMGEIYEIIEEKPSDKNCNPLKSIIRDKFCLDDEQSMSILTDTDIILYIQMLEHINIAACRQLKSLAGILKYDDVKQLLTECFDESIDNDALFALIAKEYYGI